MSIDDPLHALLLALRDGQLRARRERAHRTAQEPMAVIGVSGNASTTASEDTVIRLRSAMPGVTEVTIYAPTEAECSKAIEQCLRMVDREGGFGKFRGPRRCIGGFGAIGEIQDPAYAQAAE
jgi:hypothetical protein